MRYRAFEFQGRIDTRFRVEPGEIEAALRVHELVTDSAVLVHPGVSGEQRLVAYVVREWRRLDVIATTAAAKAISIGEREPLEAATSSRHQTVLGTWFPPVLRPLCAPPRPPHAASSTSCKPT